MESSFVAAHRFSDFDALAESARAWSLDLRQIDRGAFDGSILQAGGGGVLLSHARFGRTLVQEGEPPPGLRTVAVPARPSVRLEWRGHEVGGNQVMLFPAGGELHAVSNELFEVFTISFPETLLHDGLVASEAGRLTRPDIEVVSVSSRAMTRLRRSLQAVCDLLAADEDMPSVSVGLTSVVTESLLPTIASGCPVRPDVQLDTRARRGVDIALAHLESVGGEMPPTVAEWAAVADVSERTLRYAFRDRFGVSPKQYLLAYRLNGVRRELRGRGVHPGGIRDAALRWGFWHMGQFAADYRRQFGELPSETLRRPTRNPPLSGKSPDGPGTLQARATRTHPRTNP